MAYGIRFITPNQRLIPGKVPQYEDREQWDKNHHYSETAGIRYLMLINFFKDPEELIT